jgi:membrane protease YdiL (CAAX protease family)
MNNSFKISTLEAFFLFSLLIISHFFSIPVFEIMSRNQFSVPYLYPVVYTLPYLITLSFLGKFWFQRREENLTFLYKFSNRTLYLPMILFFIGCYFFSEILVYHLPDENAVIFKVLDENFGLNMVEEVRKYLDEMEKSLKEIYSYFNRYPYSALLTVGILAPICEEFFFRGVLLQGLLNKGKSQIFALLFSSFIFSIAHLNPWQMVGAFILGTAIGWVYMKTKSLWNAILLHIINNFTVGLIYIIYKTETVFELFNMNLLIIFVLSIVFIISFGYFFITLNNKLNLEKKNII